MQLEIISAPAECLYSYGQSRQIEILTDCIGHLQGGFDGGLGFHITWSVHSEKLITNEFKKELYEILHMLREPSDVGLLSSRINMERFCCKHTDAVLERDNGTEYVFKLRTSQYTYMLRCNLDWDDKEDFFLYVYISRQIECHMKNAERGIRFITPHYEKLFSIPDGDLIRIYNFDGSFTDLSCRYVDDCHMEVDGFIYHIRQFAERMMQNGSAVIPLRSSLPKECYGLLKNSNEIILIKRGEQGYYKTDLDTGNAEENRKMVRDMNQKLGITLAQEEAMLAGSMFGWRAPTADPKYYVNKILQSGRASNSCI